MELFLVSQAIINHDFPLMTTIEKKRYPVSGTSFFFCYHYLISKLLKKILKIKHSTKYIFGLELQKIFNNHMEFNI